MSNSELIIIASCPVIEPARESFIHIPLQLNDIFYEYINRLIQRFILLSQ